MKKVLAIVLSMMLIIVALPMGVLADGVELPVVVFPEEKVEYAWAEDHSTCTATFREETETVVAASVVTPATCTTPEITAYTATFTNEQFEEQVAEIETAPALGHAWGEVQYNWSYDFSTCTATRTCTRDAEHVETETVNSTSEVTTPATCTGAGVTTYTATFTNPAFAPTTDYDDEVPAATGHTAGEATYVWSDDNTTCTATIACTECGEVIATETVNTTSVVTVEPTEEAPGTRTFTATFTNAAFTEQTKDVEEEYQAILWGDANGDGVISNKDVVRLKNYLANFDDEIGESTYQIFPGADANGDGVISNKDVVRLKNYLANFDDETGESTYTLGPAN